MSLIDFDLGAQHEEEFWINQTNVFNSLMERIFEIRRTLKRSIPSTAAGKLKEMR
jgi:hypothetical protein